MALLPIELVESFTITIRHPRRAHRDCKFHGICISLSLNCVHDCYSSFSSRLRSCL